MADTKKLDSKLFDLSDIDETQYPFLVEGVHEPDSLARASGVWIASAGNAMLPVGEYKLKPQEDWIWFTVQNGEMVLENDNLEFPITDREGAIIPPYVNGTKLCVIKEVRVLWIAVRGPLVEQYMQNMGAVSRKPLKQGVLPAQLKLARNVVQAAVRAQAAEQTGASAQLQQLLWAMLASHSGQPVAMNAVLSHEIAKVLDEMHKHKYKESYSLNDMADISRMPVETFRKRFVSEVGMPPQSYQLHCKMERAKMLLKDGISVRQTGVEVGMKDPYHFSKTFKNIVGVSPSKYCKATRE
ncbi:MAG: helix-turn-helix transcriptional regulator [Eubacteriales bacterium]|nr:helix-turn-helix transcriptional regulator [Eubacteriales bacterium]